MKLVRVGSLAANLTTICCTIGSRSVAAMMCPGNVNSGDSLSLSLFLTVFCFSLSLCLEKNCREISVGNRLIGLGERLKNPLTLVSRNNRRENLSRLRNVHKLFDLSLIILDISLFPWLLSAAVVLTFVTVVYHSRILMEFFNDEKKPH